eukprot:7159473-Prymnesium_polylepis.2
MIHASCWFGMPYPSAGVLLSCGLDVSTRAHTPSPRPDKTKKCADARRATAPTRSREGQAGQGRSLSHSEVGRAAWTLEHSRVAPCSRAHRASPRCTLRTLRPLCGVRAAQRPIPRRLSAAVAGDRTRRAARQR